MPREEGGDIPKEKQKIFEQDRKNAIEKMVGKRYTPHRKPNERILVKGFSQEGEKEMVVFDEIRLDQGPIPRSTNKLLSIKDFYTTYVTFARKARPDDSYGEHSDEKTMKKETKTSEGGESASLEEQIKQLKKEKEILLKEKYSSLADMGKQKINLDRIKAIDEDIAMLEKRLRTIDVGDVQSEEKEMYLKPEDVRGDLRQFIGRTIVIPGRGEGKLSGLTSSGALVLGWKKEENALPNTPKTGEHPFALDVIQKWGQGIDALSGPKEVQKIALDKEGIDAGEYFEAYPLEKKIEFLELEYKTLWEDKNPPSSLQMFKEKVDRAKALEDKIKELKEKHKDSESSPQEEININSFGESEKKQGIEGVKTEINKVQSFEDVYEILETYRDDITGDIDTEMSYDAIVEQIKNAHESFRSSVKDNLVDEEYLVVPQTLPNEIFFKGEKIILNYSFWKELLAKVIKEEQSKSVDLESLEGQGISPDIREEVGESMSQEGQKSPEESAFEQEIQNAKSLEDLIERITAYQGDIFDGESVSSKEDIIRVLTALSVSVLTQEPNAPRPSENDQYQSDFFSKIPEAHDLQERARQLTDKEWEEKYPDAGKNPKEEEGERERENPNADKGDEGVEGEKKDEGKQDTETQEDHEGIKTGFNFVPVSSTKEIPAEEKEDEEGDFLRELTKELGDARREYAQNIYNGEKKKRYNDVLVRYNTEVSSRFGEFIGEKEFEQIVRANEIQEQLAIKDIRAEHLIEKSPLWEKGKVFLQNRIDEWKKMPLKKKLLVSASIAGVGGIGLATGATALGAGALVAGTAVRFVSAAATTTGFKGILESYAEKLYEGAERERTEQARTLFRENEYGSDSQEQRIDNITRLLTQSAEKQADRARKRRLDRHARTAVALAGALTLAMASRCLGQAAVDTAEGYFGDPLNGGVTEPQGKIGIDTEPQEPIAYDKDRIFPDESLPEIKTIEVPVEMTPEEYIQAHPEMFREISGREWMDNNTSLQVGSDGKITGADLNELKLHWGGGGDGIDDQGNYVFDVVKMTTDGSFHKDLSVDARDAIQKGELKMLFTLDGNTQSYGIEIPVKPDGSVVIDPQSPQGKLLFQTVGEGADASVEFKGKFAEVGVIGEDGKFTVLSTHTGDGLESITDMVKKEIMVPPHIDQEMPPSEPDRVGGGDAIITSEEVIVGDEQREIIPPITVEPITLEEPVVPLEKESPLEKVIVDPNEMLRMSATMALIAGGIHRRRKGRIPNQPIISPSSQSPETAPSQTPLESEEKNDGEEIIASLREYKEYEKGLSLEEKKKINNTVKKFEELANKTEEELKAMTAQEFGGLLIGMKIKNRTSSFVTAKVEGENEDIQTLIREEMLNPKEEESAYEYIRRSIIQSMVLTREYK